MLDFINGFTCTMHNERDELVIHFLQNEPIVSEDGTVSNQVNFMPSIIMNKDVAQGLADSILEVLSNHVTDNSVNKDSTPTPEP